MVSAKGPRPVGTNSTKIVQEAPAPSVPAQLPPVPGNEPPKNLNGSASPTSLIAVAEDPPVLLIVKL